MSQGSTIQITTYDFRRVSYGRNAPAYDNTFILCTCNYILGEWANIPLKYLSRHRLGLEFKIAASAIFLRPGDGGGIFFDLRRVLLNFGVVRCSSTIEDYFFGFGQNIVSNITEVVLLLGLAAPCCCEIGVANGRLTKVVFGSPLRPIVSYCSLRLAFVL